MAGDSREPFPFDGRSFPLIETFEVWLAELNARAPGVETGPWGRLRGTTTEAAIVRLVSKGGDDLSCLIPLGVLAKLRDDFDGLLKAVEERNR